jgi:hypothetical protein
VNPTTTQTLSRGALKKMNTFAEALPTNSSRPNAAGPVEETVPDSKSELGRRYRGVRRFTEKLCETLEPEDYVIQTMPEASPTKWNRPMNNFWRGLSRF